MKHTKGEWFVYNEKQIKEGTETMGIDCKNGKEEKSIIVFQDPYDINPEEELANAKLIAAAPELFKALQIIAESDYSGLKVTKEDVLGFIKIAKQAIQKATE